MKSIKTLIQNDSTLSKILAKLSSLNDDGTLKQCQECGRPLFKREGTGEDYCWNCETIAIEDARLAAETVVAARNIEFQNQLERFKEYSLINAKLEKASFENYSPTNDEQVFAKKVCLDYAKKFKVGAEQTANIMIWGPYGTGKSHLAKSITDVVMQRGIACLFISMPKLLTKIRSTYQSKDGMTEFAILELIAKVPLLVLDDMGAEQTKQEQGEKEFSWQKTKLFEIIDSRAGRPTIYTMNMDPQKLKQNYGEREASRILEDTFIVYVSGENYRTRKHEWWT